MSVKKYSVKKDGNKQLSAHFRVKEFRCMDGSDEVLISDKLVDLLEKLRAKLAEKLGGECTVNITSGYRTPAYNKKVSRSSQSQHIKGNAADINCQKDGQNISWKIVCTAAQDVGFNGIAKISGIAVHVDVRGYRWWADETKNYKAVSDFYPYCGVKYPTPTATIKRGDNGTPVRWLQEKLNKAGYKLDIDGIFGAATEKEVRALQTLKRVNGVVDQDTLDELKKY